MKKTILYTQRVEIIESYNERRDYADQRIADFLYSCGYYPLPIPNNKDIAESIFKTIDPAGIVLTGGNSLTKYGGDAPERDNMEKLLVEYSISRNVPLLGFRRGMQVILDYFGYSLIKVEGHVAKRHLLNYNGAIREVNSYHNQACISLSGGQGLVALASSEDGVIESVKYRTYPITGIMWHPEREDVYSDEDINLFKDWF